ncbi:hypothetical protein CTA2_3014 [Colletotrichum tanaceti]|nr:hypothetical protein CTA2_3014 [Colletotrichum tanaceti]
MKEWTAGTTQTNFNKHFSYLVIGGPRNRVYWFLFVNMGKTHYGPELPRFSKEDEARLVQEHRDDKITKDLTFGELYAAKISSVLTPLPEYVFKKWHFNRIMTIGDAAHKLEPIAGQGGNSAIETAAVLANNLANLLKTCPPGGPGPTTDQIHDVFLQTQEKREPRVWDLVRASHGEQRIAAMESPLLELAARYLVPVVSVDDKLDPWGTNIEGGHKLDLLDTPRRPHATPFFDELASRPLGGAPATLPRLAVGAALCGILYVAQRALCLDTEALVREKSVLGHPLKKEFTGLAPVDALLSLLTSAFAEATSGPDLDWRLQSFYFLMNLIPVIYIWTLEGYRNGNHLSLVSWPWLFAAAYQLVGIGMVAPVYYLVSLYTTRRAVYSRPTGRPVPSSVAKVLPLCLVLGYVVPTILMFLPLGDGAAQQDVIAFWQGSPVYVAVLAWVLSGALARASPTKSLDWEIFETRDLAWLRLGYAFCFSAAATLHLSALAFARLSPSVSLVRAFADLPSVASMGLGTDLVGFWKYDMLLCFVSVAVWCLYSVYELRRLGYVTTRTAVGAAVATLAGQVLVGPGATYAALWAWREDVIAGLVKE